MMNVNMRKVMSCIGAISSAITCLIMVIYEVLYMHIPAPARIAFTVSMLIYVIAEYGMKKAK